MPKRTSYPTPRAVELCSRDRVIDDRDRSHFVRRVVEDGDVVAGEDQLEVTLAVFLDEPGTDVGNGADHRDDAGLHHALRHVALAPVDYVDDEGRAPHFSALAKEAG